MRQGDAHRTSGARPDQARTTPDQSLAFGWSQALAVFEGLSRPGRLAVFRLILSAGPEGVGSRELMRRLKTTGSALTFHLRALSEVGLIKADPPGRPMADGAPLRFLADLATLEALLDLLRREAGRGGD